MSGRDTVAGPYILQSAFVHFVKVEVVCPLCGHAEVRVFYRDGPTGSFFPVHRCPCGRYEYSHSVHR